jgi:hypothetical protein
MNKNQGFVGVVSVIVIAIVILAGGYYFAQKSGWINSGSDIIVQPKQQNQMIRIFPGGISTFQASTFVAVDVTGKTWTVNYSKSKFYEGSGFSVDDPNSVDGNFNVWIAEKKRELEPCNGPGCMVPGNTTITGIVGNDGILYADTIFQHRQ